MSDFITSLLANMAESAIDAAAQRRRQSRSPIVRRSTPVAAQPWRPPAMAPNVVLEAEAPPTVEPSRAPARPAEPDRTGQAPRHAALLRLFATPSSVLYALVAAEVLAPPLALREDNLWGRRGV